MTELRSEASCIGGGHAYVAAGSDLVLLAFTEEVGWWKNAVGFTPDDARRLAAILVRQADVSEQVERDHG